MILFVSTTFIIHIIIAFIDIYEYILVFIIKKVISSPKVSLGLSGSLLPVYCCMRSIPCRHTRCHILGSCTFFRVLGWNLLSHLSKFHALFGGNGENWGKHAFRLLPFGYSYPTI